MSNIALVVTTISEPNKVLKSLAEGSVKHRWKFIVVGDFASPKNFELQGCDYFDLDRQMETGFSTAVSCAQRHYARKNLGYLVAIKQGAEIIVETDDDNFPQEAFWQQRSKTKSVKVLTDKEWVNVYRYFSTANIWPRGFPLNYVKEKIPSLDDIGAKETRCPIQQGLADDNPDVDAIYRLILSLPQRFENHEDVALGRQSWCPFNSQNTTWWKEVFPLLYLPSFCSFRMTDIWRSFIAQKIIHENDWAILFHQPTVIQKRNEHNLMKDFEGEVPGYLCNNGIKKVLSDIYLPRGVQNIPQAMKMCYEKLVDKGIFDRREISVLNAWFTDLESLAIIEKL